MSLPTPAERERLYLLMEEASEVVQICSKILRHGYSSKHPNGGSVNRKLLQEEIGDFQAVMTIMVRGGDIYHSNIVRAANDKLGRVQKFLYHITNIKLAKGEKL